MANKIVKSDAWIKECEAAVQDSQVRNPTNNMNSEAVPQAVSQDGSYAPASSYQAPVEDEDDDDEIDLK